MPETTPLPRPWPAYAARAARWVMRGVALLALAIWLFLSPLFRWQTGVVVFGIDSYSQFAVDAIPFFDEDLAGLTDSLSPLLSSRLGTKPLRLTGFESADAVRTSLPGRMRQLPLRA